MENSVKSPAKLRAEVERFARGLDADQREEIIHMIDTGRAVIVREDAETYLRLDSEDGATLHQVVGGSIRCVRRISAVTKRKQERNKLQHAAEPQKVEYADE